MHREEGDIETDERQPEVPLSQTLVHHPACYLGEPVVHGTQQREYTPTDQHIVQVRNDKVAILCLKIKGNRRHHDTGNPTDDKCKDKAQYIKQWRLEIELAMPECG